MKLICAQIDLARQKENIPFIKSYIDFAAENGYNSMLCYLENAVRSSETEYFDKNDTYSLDEIREIVNYGDKKGVSLIPAFENLGHMEKFFAYPELEDLSECENEQLEGRGFCNTPRGSCGCSSNEKLYEFFDKYIGEISSVFTSEYIHMGLDEPFDFAVCPKCAERIKKGESKAEMFFKHVMRSYDLVKKLGKTMMMWDDFFEYADIVEKLPRDVVLCNWNYYFVSDLPAGHWTGRVKKDWFHLYDKLGFKYIFCAYMGDYSSAYNVKSLTRYAMKYHPIGALATSWEKSTTFYRCSYPIMAAAGRLWSGRITEEDFQSVYAEVTGSEIIAGLLLSTNVPMYYSSYVSTVMSECDYLVKYSFRGALSSVVKTMKSEAFNPRKSGYKSIICKDLYRAYAELYAKTLTEKATDELFDVYERGGKTDSGTAAARRGKALLERAEELYRECEIISDGLNNECRNDIILHAGCINKYPDFYKKIAEIRSAFENAKKSAVLYVDLMMHDGFGTPNAKIAVKYEGEKEEIIYSGGIKPSYTSFECGGVYTFKFLLGKVDKLIDYVIFTSAGEGQTFPVHFRYVSGDKEYIASSAEKIGGEAYFENNVVYPDTRFAIVGNGDGEAHFNDVKLGKRENSIKIGFKEVK